MAEPIRWQDRWWHYQPDGTWLLFNEETQTWEPYSGGVTAPTYTPSAGMSTGAKWAIGCGIGAAVLVIVLILAAIALPVFLRQREKAWIDQTESALKNAAVAEESYYTDHSSYTDSIADLEAQGLKVPAFVVLEIRSTSPNTYCIEALHEQLSNRTWHIDSQVGRMREGPCP